MQTMPVSLRTLGYEYKNQSYDFDTGFLVTGISLKDLLLKEGLHRLQQREHRRPLAQRERRAHGQLLPDPEQRYHRNGHGRQEPASVAGSQYDNGVVNENVHGGNCRLFHFFCPRRQRLCRQHQATGPSRSTATAHIPSTARCTPHIAASNETINGTDGVTLEEFLYASAMYPVTSVTIDGHTYDWAWFASTTDFDTPVLVLPNGSIFDGTKFLKADNIVVNVTEKPAHSSLDIEPSMLYALGLGGNDTLIHEKSNRIVLFYVDALGYDRYELAKSKGIIDNITSLGEPQKIACVYPSVSIVNSKTLVSGIAPNASKGDLRSYYPDGPTILDSVTQHGMTGVLD